MQFNDVLSTAQLMDYVFLLKYEHDINRTKE